MRSLLRHLPLADLVQRGAYGRLAAIGALLAALALLPLVFGVESRVVNVTLYCAVYAILALGLNVVVGFVGLLDLGYVTFLATGAIVALDLLLLTETETGYVLAVRSAEAIAGNHPFASLPGLFAILLIAGGVCALLGFLRGIPTLKLTGDYYAIVTLGLAEIVYLIYFNADAITGGTIGMKLTPDARPTIFGEPLYHDTFAFYGLVMGTLLLAVVVLDRLQHSRIGRAWAAIRLDETAARASGIDVARHKLLAFAVSGFWGGVGGALFALWIGTVAAKSLDIWQSILILAAVVLGGMGSIRGVLLGSALIFSLREILREQLSIGSMTLRVPPEAANLVYGLLLIAVMRVRPQGLLPRLVGDSIPTTPADDEALLKTETPLFALREPVSEAAASPAAPEATPQGPPLLEAKDLCRHFGGLKAVEKVCLGIERGKVTSLIGPNGAGKTSVFNALTGIFPPTSGEVTLCLDGEAPVALAGKRPDEICRLGVARTFQNIHLFADLPVIDNVKVGLHARTRAGLLASVLRLPSMLAEEEAIHAAALRYLDVVGLTSKAHERATSLAYGDQRRLEIARALATHPKLLLLDEPAAGMNPRETEALMGLIRKICARGGTILLIEHDMKLVMGISDHVYVMDHGEGIAHGSPASVRKDPKVVEAYLGADDELGDGAGSGAASGAEGSAHG